MNNNQEGSSFTESLITIVVAGIACVAFISVVASLVRETKNREVSELMTSYAFEGLGEMRRLSSYRLPEELDPIISHTYSIIEGDLELVNDIDCTSESSGCELIDLNEGDGFFYRKIEVVSATSNEALGVAKVTVEVGRTNPTGKSTLDSYQIDGFIQL
ncbi:MAG: hypothetical protein ABIC57_03025, partial [bacterium]